MNLVIFKILAVGADIACPPGTTGSCSTGLPSTTANSAAIQNILQVVFGIVAAVAVLIIVIAGFRFVLSGGNPDNAAKARETIIYAAVGLVIALSAEVLVSFVLYKVG